MKQTLSNDDQLQTDHAQVGLNISNQILMISIQVELYDHVLENLQSRVLNMLQDHQLKGVLLDLSHIQLLDNDIAKKLKNMLSMTKLLGAKSVVVGIQPNVAACMILWGHRWEGIPTARSIDDGLCLLAHA